jgi:hypothetical protein
MSRLQRQTALIASLLSEWSDFFYCRIFPWPVLISKKPTTNDRQLLAQSARELS